MLWFLWIAAKRGFRVDAYDDDAEGFLEKDAAGNVSMTRVVLRPRVALGDGHEPSHADITAMHDEAHHLCNIANSVKTSVSVEPR